MIIVYHKMVSVLMAFCVVGVMGYSWDYLTERPRHRRLKALHRRKDSDDSP